ncbi:hypothetical protein T4D_9103 [Trichinella pseudospiralis]|uniref:Uncharacterized protein n=1 Tax=Trichinella pseudospiralis TaxID=6337 RepID=A0A0V1FEL1_TRIPS|nr:hypothetical protein T4D_9103 [Trichinella pseudospiralis]
MSIKEKKTFVLDLQNYLQILIDLTRQLKLMLCEQKMFLNRTTTTTTTIVEAMEDACLAMATAWI